VSSEICSPPRTVSTHRSTPAASRADRYILLFPPRYHPIHRILHYSSGLTQMPRSCIN
jgi:hypothetical protein